MAFRIVDGKIYSDTLEFHVADHCNLSCFHCSHLAPVSQRYNIQINEIESSLNILKPIYHSNILRLVGGEPTLNPNLLAIVKMAKAIKISDCIRLLSNGTLIDKFSDELLGEIDTLDLSIYPGSNISKSDLVFLRDRCNANGTALYVKMFPEFRAAFSTLKTSNTDLTKRIFKTCLSAHMWACHSIYKGKFFKCAIAPNIDRELVGGGNFRSGVSIDESSDFCAKLLSYLQEVQQPLDACSFCLGSVGKKMQQKQLLKRSWLQGHNDTIEMLVDYEYLTRQEEKLDPTWDCVESYSDRDFLPWSGLD